MSDLPDGIVTLLFTDIEGSTRLLRQLEGRYAEVLTEHRRLLRAVFQANGGQEVSTQGDAFFVVFGRAQQALRAAVEAQRALYEFAWPEGCAVRVRMGLHTGLPTHTPAGYVGMDVHRGARLMAAGHGGQVLVSDTTHDLVGEDLPEGVQWRSLGRHRLKDMAGPERIYQIDMTGLPAEFPALRTINLRPNNLPASVTALIGREKEMDAALRLLRHPDVRLLTLTGTGGTGKTRLSLQLASGLLGDFEDGVFFVTLAPVSDALFFVPAVAQALKVRESAEQPLLESVKEFLHHRQMLLILDNFEQIMGAAPRVAEMLSACPQLKCLVTSRVALHLRGERELLVPPLALPDLRRLPPLLILAGTAAVELFVERAQAVKQDFALNETNATAIAELCADLDGLPLAIELAAPHIRTLSPQTLQAQMERRFQTLSDGPRDLPERHQALRRCIAWSYDLLGAGEQQLFQRLGVFMGGCRRDAVEAVVSDLGISQEEVRAGLTSLADQSLVLSTEHAPGDTHYALLETIREYSLEQLSASEQREDARRLHLAHYFKMAETADAEMSGNRQAGWLERLETEHDNMRAALQWALESEPAQALRLAGALGRFWEMHGHFGEGRGWQTAALEMADAAPAEWRAKVLCNIGKLAFLQGDFRAAWSLLEAGLAASREAADPLSIASALLNLGIVASYQGDLSAAATLLEESLAVYRGHADQHGIALALAHLGIVNFCLLDFALANERLEESVALSRELDDNSATAFALFFRAESSYAEEDYVTAAPLLEQSLALSQEIHQTLTSAYSLLRLARVAAHEQDDYVTASALMSESTAMLQQLGNKWCLAFNLEAYGYLAAAQGRAERAAHILGAAHALREMVGAPLPPCYHPLHDRYLEAMHTQLPPNDFSAAWAQGRAWTLEQAVAYALEESAKV